MSFDLVAAFREQAHYCGLLGSPFTQRLLECAADDIQADGLIARLYKLRSDWRREDAAPLRLAGALHARARDGLDRTLGALYPVPDRSWDISAIWAQAMRAVAKDPQHFVSFLQRAPQTNETARSIALLPAFLELGKDGAPLHMLELGASAGLNLYWDKFEYDARGWSWRGGRGPRITTQWEGSAPTYLGPLNVASRAGCDLQPLDIRNAGERARLRAYIWADQFTRLARFDESVSVALAAQTRVDAADAADWIGAKLEEPLKDGVTVVYHSVFQQYLSDSAQSAIEAAIEAASARATLAQRLAWVRFEHDQMLGGDGDSYWVDCAHWPEGGRRRLAEVDAHGRWVRFLER